MSHRALSWIRQSVAILSVGIASYFAYLWCTGWSASLRAPDFIVKPQLAGSASAQFLDDVFLLITTLVPYLVFVVGGSIILSRYCIPIVAAIVFLPTGYYARFFQYGEVQWIIQFVIVLLVAYQVARVAGVKRASLSGVRDAS